MASSAPETNLVALGAGTHTWMPTPESGALQDELIGIMRKHNITKLDSSRSYGLGASETAIGNKGLGSEFTITTKAPTFAGSGSGKPEAILKAAKESREALRVEKVAIYLLHGPDDSVPVGETYSAIQTLYKEGRFDKFGVSNFTREQFLNFYNYGKEHNYVLPTIFQASYSPAVRGNETLLFPTLRDLSVSIQAYSPMAGGFLARTSDELKNPAAGGKWDPATTVGKFYRALFYKPSYLEFLDEWSKLVEESGVSRVGLAYRWTRYHSALSGELGDEMLIGAGSAGQFEETLKEIEKGHLEKWVADRIDGLWNGIKGDAEVDNLRAFREVFGG